MHSDPQPRALPESDLQLVEAARVVIDSNADSDGRHTVGAAVRDADGRIYVGVNLAHFTGGPCAELVAPQTVAVLLTPRCLAVSLSKSPSARCGSPSPVVMRSRRLPSM